MEQAQKRLALQQEKLEVDKQLLRAEKKHLKQEKARYQRELDECHARIRQLEAKLRETKQSDSQSLLIQELQEKLDISQQAEHELEALQTQLHEQHDTHDALVGELQLKISQQQEEINRLQQGGVAISPSKASSNNHAIQQYKNKLQSLRLAMEVAVRRTETEWKEKVDELEVQLATQGGEMEDALEEQMQELQSQISQLQEQLEYCERSHQEERAQLEATIQRLREQQNGGTVATSSEVSALEDDELRKTKDELRSLQRKQAEYTANQQVLVKTCRDLIDQIKSTESHDAADKLPLTMEQTTALEQQSNSLKINRSISLVSRNPSRKSSRVHETKLRHVTDLEWSGSNQKGTYTGYVGENGEPHGRGFLRVDNGDVYEGEFGSGRRHGQGVYTWATGDLYTGPWNKNRRHGHGVFVWSDGRLYDGEYNMGKREGRGTFTWPYGAKYEGEYVNNKRSGHGVYLHADGKTYTGEYHDDRPHGNGVLTDQKGNVIHEGTWIEGKFVG